MKKTVNFDAPDAYHLYFGDEAGLARLDPHLVRVRGRAPRPRGRGDDPHDPARRRLRGRAGLLGRAARRRGHESVRGDGTLRFADPDGLGLELVVADDGNPPLRAVHPEVPAEHAILGVEGARAFAAQAPTADRALLTETLGFTEAGEGEYRLQGEERHFHWGYDPATEAGVQGSGTVHHIAWHSRDDDHVAWQERARRGRHAGHAGHRPRLLRRDLLPPAAGHPVRDRDDLARLRRRRGPGAPRRGSCASRSQHEHLRPQLEKLLQPVVNPRTAQRAEAAR